MHTFGCIGQLRSQLEHRIARTSKREIPEDCVVCGSSSPTTLDAVCGIVSTPLRGSETLCRTRGRSSGASPFASASSARRRLTSPLGGLGVTSTGRADAASSFNLANLALVRSTSPCTSSNFLQRSRSNLGLNPCSHQGTLDRLLLWRTFVTESN